MRCCRYAEEVQTEEHGFGLDRVLQQQAWKLRGEPGAWAVWGGGCDVGC